MKFAIDAAENGLLPDPVVRAGMRRLIARRLAAHRDQMPSARTQAFRDLVAQLRQGPIAVHTQDANAQHYEVPSAFFERHLGDRKSTRLNSSH